MSEGQKVPLFVFLADFLLSITAALTEVGVADLNGETCKVS